MLKLEKNPKMIMANTAMANLNTIYRDYFIMQLTKIMLVNTLVFVNFHGELGLCISGIKRKETEASHRLDVDIHYSVHHWTN